MTTDLHPAANRPALDADRFRRQVHACWLGKAVGGTLGMPWEGFDGPNDLSFYDPVPTGMVANDDLDLQVLWACVLDEMGDDVRVDRHVLAEAWRHRVSFPWGEYGVAKRNLAHGLEPPLSGSHDNWWQEGMGAAIRSEVWACLAAGDPDTAAAYAYEDACVDHAGDGVWAEVFLARLQAAAFVMQDRDALLDLALAPLPDDSRLKHAIQHTRDAWSATHDWQGVRRSVLDRYGDPDFTHVHMNLAFTVLAWLAGDSDFSRSICLTVNCGQDTDCTAATLGSLLAILDPDAIDPRWLEPIGQQLVVDDRILGIHPPDTLAGFTDLVLDLHRRLDYRPVDADTPVASADHLAYAARIGYFTLRGQHRCLDFDWMPSPHEPAPNPPADAAWTRLPGQCQTLDPDAYPDDRDLMYLEVPFSLAERRRCKVCFSSEAQTSVWLDGRFVFGRDRGGRMMPSPHLAPLNTYHVLDLDPGKHTLVAVLKKPSRAIGHRYNRCTWNLDLADATSLQWLTRTLFVDLKDNEFN